MFEEVSLWGFAFQLCGLSLAEPTEDVMAELVSKQQCHAEWLVTSGKKEESIY